MNASRVGKVYQRRHLKEDSTLLPWVPCTMLHCSEVHGPGRLPRNIMTGTLLPSYAESIPRCHDAAIRDTASLMPRHRLTRQLARRDSSPDEVRMDEVAAFNQARWRALAEADALYTRPLLNLDADAARARVDPFGWLGSLDGMRVLCLAGGGGQQSAAFGLLGAQVTVVDLSDAQLERDAQVAAHYGIDLQIVRADMRDLSILEAGAFDLVQHSYSINFVPDVQVVFGQVARLLRPGGLYQLMFANPFTLAVNPRHWTGEGYLLKQPYLDGAPIQSEDEAWVYRRDDGPSTAPSIPGPREYRHTLSTVMNGLVEHGFSIRQLADAVSIYPDQTAEPGTWDHFVSVAPPWLIVLCRFEEMG
jgi:2-polyprenyl-3-methyl-5-hydroxy-6-metoxy-1,4-benzoquinol methylase